MNVIHTLNKFQVKKKRISPLCLSHILDLCAAKVPFNYPFFIFLEVLDFYLDCHGISGSSKCGSLNKLFKVFVAGMVHIFKDPNPCLRADVKYFHIYVSFFQPGRLLLIWPKHRAPVKVYYIFDARKESILIHMKFGFSRWLSVAAQWVIKMFLSLLPSCSQCMVES